MKPIHEVIKLNRTDADVAREWAGVERRAPIAPIALPALKAKRDHFALIVVAVVVVAAALAVVLF